MNTKRTIPEGTLARALTLYECGLGAEHAAKAAGISAHTVLKRARQAGIPIRRAGGGTSKHPVTFERIKGLVTDGAALSDLCRVARISPAMALKLMAERRGAR